MEKISTGIRIGADAMKKLDEMARADLRERSAEIEFLVQEEYVRRKTVRETDERVLEYLKQS